jgi:predicted aspartyl protease
MILAFSIRHKTRTNILMSEVAVTCPQNNNNPKVYEKDKFRAVWDTGATNTVINEKIAEKMGLIPINFIKSYTANGEADSKVYCVDLYLPNNVRIQNLQVTDGKLGDGLDVLVGMDVISIGDFAITNMHGATTFTFCMPSVHQIDFVEEVNELNKKQKDAVKKAA